MVLKEIEEIPKSTKPYVGFFLANGLNEALEKACNKMQMCRSEFVRYCIMRVLQELSLISEQVKSGENARK